MVEVTAFKKFVIRVLHCSNLKVDTVTVDPSIVVTLGL